MTGASAEPSVLASGPPVDAVPFEAVHTGEAEARNGAVRVCGGFDCPGVYGGFCQYDDVTELCPCGCGEAVSLGRQQSFAYDRFGALTGGDEEDAGCLAASYEPANAALFADQRALVGGEVSVSDYSVRLVENDDSGAVAT